MSQAVTYTVNVLISQKRFKMELILQITNRKSYMTHQNAGIPMTLSDIRGYSFTYCKPFQV